MDDGDVITMSKRGQWVNRVVGGEELSQSFRSREEAADAGRELALQLGSRVALANTDAQDTLERLARAASPEATLRRIEAIAECRDALDRNVAPLLAVEAMTMALRAG